MQMLYIYKDNNMGCCFTSVQADRKKKEGANITSQKINLACDNCKNPFDLANKCPMIICHKKHNLCKACVALFHARKINHCKLCQQPLMRSAIKNKKLIEIIEEKNQLSTEVVSPTKIEKGGNVARTLKRAEQNGYGQVENLIKMESFTITMIDERKNDIKAIIDLSLFKKVRFLNLSSEFDVVCTPATCKQLEDNASFGFGTLPYLKQLHLRNRHLHSIPNLGRLSSLQTLGLGRNGLSRIKNLDDYTSLKYLFLANNSIIYIQCLESLINLQCLNLGGNRISKIQNLHNQKKLRKLQLYHNLISKIQNLEDLASLQEVDLDDNKIVVVQNLRKIPKLTDIQLNNNPIQAKRSREQITFLKQNRGIDLIQIYGWDT